MARASDNPPRLSSGDDPVHVTPRTLQLGVAVLSILPYPEEAESLFGVQSGTSDWWIRDIAFGFLKSLYVSYGEYLGRDRSVAKLEDMARMLCFNTAKPVLDLPTASDFLAQFKGLNLRWESLGITFLFWDLRSRPQGPEVAADTSCPDNFFARALATIVSCVELCQEFSDGNMFHIYLSHKRTIFESLISGDASRQTWKYHVDTVSDLIFLGMHAEPNTHNYQPTFHSEAKRRILWMVYNIDKVALSITGRPSLLCEKFITTPLPLDIKDEYLVLDSESLRQKARDTLDERGWSTEGGFSSTTTARARFMLAKIREQIAEVALRHEPEASIDELKVLKEKQAAALAEFPLKLQLSSAELTDPTVAAKSVFPRLLLRLESLQNEFFLGRLFVRKGIPDDGTLLLISFELVSLIVGLWAHKDRFAHVRNTFEWLLIGFAAPAGGVLCKCLLTSATAALNPSMPHVTRSSVTQKLSLLIAFLDWVHPSAPNANLCRDCKLVIERVLDQALNNTPTESSMLGEFDWGFPAAQLDFDFDLMDTYDWLRPEPNS